MEEQDLSSRSSHHLSVLKKGTSTMAVRSDSEGPLYAEYGSRSEYSSQIPKAGRMQGFRFGVTVLIIQTIFTVVFAVTARYGYDSNSKWATSPKTQSKSFDALEDSKQLVPALIDVSAMLFLGFGFLMTFLKRYSFSAVGYNLFTSALGIEYALLVLGAFHLHDGKIDLTVESILGAMFAIATVLISFGAVLGKISLLQLQIMLLIEIPLMVANEYLGRTVLSTTDVGDTVFVHLFGATFGITISAVLTCRGREFNEDGEGSLYHSDLFAMVGSLVLWVFWPSFNSAAAVGVGQPRAVINTILAIMSSTIVVFALSAMTPSMETHRSHDGSVTRRLHNLTGTQNMVLVQNSTLAGAVAVGCSADLMLGPWLAMLIGAAGGAISVLGYRYLLPVLNQYAHDTCGVVNLHGLPALFGSLMGALVTYLLATTDVYSSDLYKIYPAMDNKGGTESARNAGLQAVFQLAAIGFTLGIAVIGGAITGFILRFVPFLDMPDNKLAFVDDIAWDMPEDE